MGYSCLLSLEGDGISVSIHAAHAKSSASHLSSKTFLDIFQAAVRCPIFYIMMIWDRGNPRGCPPNLPQFTCPNSNNPGHLLSLLALHPLLGGKLSSNGTELPIQLTLTFKYAWKMEGGCNFTVAIFGRTSPAIFPAITAFLPLHTALQNFAIEGIRYKFARGEREMRE